MRWYIGLVFSVAVSLAALAWVVGYERGYRLGSVKASAQAELAYQRGKRDADLRDLMENEHDMLRKVCTIWWFDMSGNQRKLK